MTQKRKGVVRANGTTPGDIIAGGFQSQFKDSRTIAALQESAEAAERESRALYRYAHKEPGVIGRQGLALASHYAKVQRLALRMGGAR